MSKEIQRELACDPRRWFASTLKPSSVIEKEMAYYGLEWGHLPEVLQNEKGIFVIGYYYRVSSQQKTIYPLDPENGFTHPKDVRQMLRNHTKRDRQEKAGFEKLAQLFFAAPNGSLTIWVSPAGNTYFYPRIYIGKISETTDSGDKTVEALDFNCDLNNQQLKALLEKLDPRLHLPPKVGVNNLLDHPILLTPNSKKPIRQPEEVLTAIKQLGINYIHNVPIEEVFRQIRENTWRERFNESRGIAQRTALKIKAALSSQNYYQALVYMAQFEGEISRRSGTFASYSSCGSAVSSSLAAWGRPLWGLPAFSLEIQNKIRTCPVCGHPLVPPLSPGHHCPYCGAEI